jgi:predicted peptidase
MRLLRSKGSVFCLAALLAGCVSVHNSEVHTEHNHDSKVSGFLAMTVSNGEQDQPAALYVPRDYDDSKEWPLIVFLHGAGERGDDGWFQMAVGIGEQVMEHPDRFPCLVYMPQCPKSWSWGSRANRNRPDASAFVTDGIEQIISKYNINEDAISLTGLSMGGFGTFIYGANNAERFSALMPICGGGNVDDAATLAKLPIRVFHGGADDVVVPERSREMVEAIKAAGGEIAYTEYPGVDHDSWSQTYSNADNIAWLLEQRRK